jgi:PleD family two-component response regulator
MKQFFSLVSYCQSQFVPVSYSLLCQAPDMLGNTEGVYWFDFHGPSEPTILVVEDEALLRMHAAGMLEENGYGVVEAENADAALKLLETRDDVRLLFTDIQMPGSCTGWT